MNPIEKMINATDGNVLPNGMGSMTVSDRIRHRMPTRRSAESEVSTQMRGWIQRSIFKSQGAALAMTSARRARNIAASADSFQRAL